MKKAISVLLFVVLAIALLDGCQGVSPAVESTGDDAGSEISSASYTIGTSYSVDIPTECSISEGIESLNVYPQDRTWLLQLATGYLGNKTTVEEFAAGWYLTLDDLTPCTIGAAEGYRYDFTDDGGRTFAVWFMFESPGETQAPIGVIYFKFPKETDLDILPLLDDPLVKYMLDSVRAPE